MAAFSFFKIIIMSRKPKSRILRTEFNRVKKHKDRAKRKGTPHELTFTQWIELLEYYNWACALCNSKYELTLEHLLPLGMGGGTTKINCVPCCYTCNQTLDSQRNRLT
jgi:hypothetical protein